MGKFNFIFLVLAGLLLNSCGQAPSKVDSKTQSNSNSNSNSTTGALNTPLSATVPGTTPAAPSVPSSIQAPQNIFAQAWTLHQEGCGTLISTLIAGNTKTTLSSPNSTTLQIEEQITTVRT